MDVDDSLQDLNISSIDIKMEKNAFTILPKSEYQKFVEEDLKADILYELDKKYLLSRYENIKYTDNNNILTKSASTKKEYVSDIDENYAHNEDETFSNENGIFTTSNNANTVEHDNKPNFSKESITKSTKTQKRKHKLKKNILEEKTKIEQPRYICDHCNSKFLSKKLLINHLKTCNKYYHFTCPYCKFTKFYAYEIYAHVKQHHQSKKVYCIDRFSGDKKTSNFKTKYKKEDKEFECTNCPSTFLTYYRLHRHVKYECRREKKYHCDYCAFETKWKSHLNRHLLRKHSGDIIP